MGSRHSLFDNGVEVEYVQWPDTADGLIDDNGTVRPMTEAEVAEWHARNPPPPLVPPDERYDEDTLQATVRLLSRQVAALQAAAEGKDPVKAVTDLKAAEADPKVLRELLTAELTANELTADEVVIRSR